MTQVENRPNSFPCFSDEEYARRYRAVRQAMEQQDVDALLIFGVRGSSEVQYLSNYLAQSPCWLLVPRDGEATCFTHFSIISRVLKPNRSCPMCASTDLRLYRRLPKRSRGKLSLSADLAS